MKENLTLSEIAGSIGAELQGDGDRTISGVASLKSASAEQISFFENERYAEDLEATQAAAVILGPKVRARDGLNVLRVEQPGVAWTMVVELFHPYARRFTDISPAAFVGEDCQIGADVGVGPGASIGNRVKIGSGSEIYPGATIGDDSVIGEECRIYSGVHVYHTCTVGSRVALHSGVVIGADGYGYTQEGRQNPTEPVIHRKIPQVGSVVIEDDVEIGANSTVDRGALGATFIGQGTKIDNMVHVAHNCVIGRHCLLVGQSGLAGSVEVGHYATIAGQAAVAGHVKVGNRATVGGLSGVAWDVPEGTTVLGIPALPAAKAWRNHALIQRLGDFRKTLGQLEKRVKELEG